MYDKGEMVEIAIQSESRGGYDWVLAEVMNRHELPRELNTDGEYRYTLRTCADGDTYRDVPPICVRHPEE